MAEQSSSLASMDHLTQHIHYVKRFTLTPCLIYREPGEA